MLRIFLNKTKRNKGQAIVEFALVIPVFLILTFGILEVGRLIFMQMTVAQAAREGARAVAVSGDRTQAAIAVNKFPGTFTTIVTPTPLVYGQPVTVQVNTTVTILTPIISAVVSPNPFPISSTANMREEHSKPIN